MQDSPPKLEISGPSALAGYASLSWTAIASLNVAVLFAVLLAVLGLISYGEKKPLIEVWLLAFPAIAVVLAFVARRQIRLSEGTRVGEKYAVAAWWIAILGGLGYMAYLWAIDFAINRDAQATFNEYTTHLGELEPSKPDDEHLFGAFLLTTEPGLRSGLNPRKPESFDRFREQIVGFRQNDLFRMTSRNRGEFAIEPLGLRDWQQKPSEITCMLSASLTCPEGEFELLVPMRAAVDEKKVRRWHIVASQEGYIKRASKTHYGWWVEYADVMARQFASDLITTLSIPGQSRFAYFAFAKPGFDSQKANHFWGMEVPAVASALAIIPTPETSPPGIAALFAKPGGATHSPEDAAKMLFCWNTGRILRSGTILKTSSELYPTIAIDEAGVTASVPVELGFSADGPGGGAAARTRAILRFDRSVDPKLFDDIQAARKLGRNSEKTEFKPPESMNMRPIPWRLVRLESDLKPISPPAPQGGPPGGGGGAMH